MESNKKEGVFNSGCMDKFAFDLGLNMTALESLASLIGACEFGEIGESPDFEEGIKRIITLVLREQERIIEEYTDQYNNSDAGLIERAEYFLDGLTRNAFNPHNIETLFKQRMAGLNTVISRNGEGKGKAEGLKLECKASFEKALTGQHGKKAS